MKIILNPIAALPNEQADTPPTVDGDILNYRGQTYDLSQLPEGAEVEAESPFVGSIKRENNQVEVSIEFKYNSILAEPAQSQNIEDYTFIVAQGNCPNPIVFKSVPEVSEDGN
ncbi:hypothetical protein EIK76_00480 [Rheinheimera mesophila]|uniref:Uncharacterized protein n=1 Tax=Rheinheimera mesophila TaxID=1547515 RepID=A0A3P3QMY3_9GAMM|nr:hypothetical protein [Rheinheimera mesophila]KKL00239.1 hypothetical protein SD53_15655 [Rheinheimera mesophila]RRJ22597.1 hypothetical protein EIK76_00480 [Rheinheimera mesophila]